MNTNDPVWVRLNERGWEVFDEFHRRLGLDPSRCREHVHVDAGWQRFQLWDLMNTFGHAMYLGAPGVPFEGNEVVFVQPSEPDETPTWRCPNQARWPGDIVGCGIVFAQVPDDEGLVDCPHCGIWFSPAIEQRFNDGTVTREERERFAAEAVRRVR